LTWIPIFSGTFKRGYKSLDRLAQQRADEAIENLLTAEDPAKLGHRLHGRWEGTFSYAIGKQFRLIFQVDFEKRSVVFLAVGTHKIY
jgi:addiction module RelE/StbE family toxin